MLKAGQNSHPSDITHYWLVHILSKKAWLVKTMSKYTIWPSILAMHLRIFKVTLNLKGRSISLTETY